MAIYIDHALGFVLPPYWRLHKDVVREVATDVSPAELLDIPHLDPLRIKWEEEKEWWTLPIDPVIAVSGKNIIIRRHPQKADNTTENRRGSVKEIWSQDDYEVNIAGVFIGDGEMPEESLRKLRGYCEAHKTIMVESALLSIYKITRLAIEDYSLPFTKGLENQMFTIKAYSDDMFDLLIKI